jgi:UDP-N-acetylglucosamine--N-acetylmuramyl-(pentapeptide) pyrophosphoryl-undecaprenol N-acetylglucosamine transferase
MKKTKTPTEKHIVIMAGGTGGHVFPGLAVAKALQDDGVKVSWLGTAQGIEAKVVPEANIPFAILKVKGVRRNGLKGWAKLPFTLLCSTVNAYRILKKGNVTAVLSMGGYVSGPGALAAKCLRLPIVLHEQNARAGLTNKVVSCFAKKVFTGFDSNIRKGVTVGNPVRAELFEVKPYQARQKGKFNVLVFGGSQGARILNEVVPEALALLPKNLRPNVVHQTGAHTSLVAETHYKKRDVTVTLTDFIDDMKAAYEKSDLIICRSGALTVAEISAVGRAAILVPLPTAVDDHQRYNAQVLSKKGAATLMLQSTLAPQSLACVLEDLLKHPEKIAEQAAAAKALGQYGAAAKIKHDVVRLC